jgi:lactate dehydrogenase-like 2-hydroxyacid dehydrogenase
MIDRLGAEDLRRVNWIVTKTRYIDDTFVNQFPNLCGIVVMSTETWMIHLRDARHVKVATVCEDRGYEVAEHALMLLLAGIKRLTTTNILRRPVSRGALLSFLSSSAATETRGAHNWSEVVSGTIYRKNVGIVGYGLIGREIHRRLAGFGASIFYFHRTRYPRAVEQTLGMTYLPLQELFGCCDAILVQLPLSPDTENLISGEILESAKPSLVLVNCGRAAVIAEDAIYGVLKNNGIAFYATDVFWREPITYFDRFRRLRNFLLTPHMAESLPQRKHDLIEQAVARIVEMAEGTQ